MKSEKKYRSSMNLMIGLLIAMGFIFISFEWSKSEMRILFPEIDEATDFIPEEQVPVVRIKQKQISLPIPRFNPDKLVIGDNQLAELDIKPELIDAVVTSEPVDDSPEVEVGTEEILEIVSIQVKPRFPGGEDAMYEFLRNNLKYPQIAQEIGIQGIVYVQFVIEKNGSVSHIEVLRSKDRSLDEEAKRIVALMPDWLPGIQNGHKVRVRMTLPVHFKLR